MDVAAAADRGRVAELARHILDGADDVLLRLFLGRELLELPQRQRGQHRSRPGAKILRGKSGADDGAQVFVHVVGFHVLNLAVGIEVLKQLLARQLLGAADDARHARIVQGDVMTDAALALEGKPHRAARDPHVAVEHRAEAEGSVLPGVFLVAHADERGLQQAHHGGEDLLAPEAAPGEVAGHAPADAR